MHIQDIYKETAMKSPAVRLILPLLLLSTLLKAEGAVYGTFIQSLKEFCLQVQDPEQRQEFELRLAQLQAALQDYRKAETERHRLLCDFYQQFVPSLPETLHLSKYNKVCFLPLDGSLIEAGQGVAVTPRECLFQVVTRSESLPSDNDFPVSQGFGFSEWKNPFQIPDLDFTIDSKGYPLAFHRQNSPRAVTLASYPF